jgi:hypothetical protein
LAQYLFALPLTDLLHSAFNHKSDRWSVMPIEGIQNRDVDGSCFNCVGCTRHWEVIKGYCDGPLLGQGRDGANDHEQKGKHDSEQIQHDVL